jgi:hypothetical protein
VDRLRQAGVSIVSISPHKLTLEEAFLGIIHSTQNTLVRA